MSQSAASPAVPPTNSTSSSVDSRDFRLFFSGQLISNLGNSITDFALPLLVYQITGSQLGLGLAFAIRMLPFLLFSLPIGAWVDRLDRKKLMIASDVLNAVLLVPIPILALAGVLPVELIFVFLFLSSSISIVFDTGRFAAVYSLVDERDLVRANGRLRANFQVTSVIGAPIVGGLIWMGVRLETVLLIDAVSFLVSAVALKMVHGSFNPPPDDEPTPVASIMSDIREGLRFVAGNPLMRATIAMVTLINLMTTVVPATIIAFGTERLGASEFELSILTAFGAAGAIALALSAAPLRERFSFSVVTFVAVVSAGALVVGLALSTHLWVAMPLWGLAFGMTILFNVCLGSLWQQTTPPRMMGRVMSTIQVVSLSVIPIGAFGGSWIADRTGQLDLVYVVSGLSMVAIGIVFFSATALRHPTRYVPEAAPMRTLTTATQSAD